MKISRIGFGTGTHGGNFASEQTKIESKAFQETIEYALENRINLFDSADSYGSHNLLSKINIPRENFTICTKTDSKTKLDVQNDISRFLQDLKTDYIDILLLHYVNDPNWLISYEGAIEELISAKQKGLVRSIGISSHRHYILQEAICQSWLDVLMARYNYAGVMMDESVENTSILLKEANLREIKTIAIKVLGNGSLVSNVSKAIQFVHSKPFIDHLVVGISSIDQIRCIQSFL